MSHWPNLLSLIFSGLLIEVLGYTAHLGTQDFTLQLLEKCGVKTIWSWWFLTVHFRGLLRHRFYQYCKFRYSLPPAPSIWKDKIQFRTKVSNFAENTDSRNSLLCFRPSSHPFLLTLHHVLTLCCSWQMSQLWQAQKKLAYKSCDISKWLKALY